MTESAPDNVHRPENPDAKMEKLDIKILVADDDSILRHMYIKMLRAYTVETVESGQQLLERLEASSPNEFSLVITDNKMPVKEGVELEGIDVLRQIKTDSRYKDLPVIVCTGNDNIYDAISEAGGIYQPKPFHIAEFVSNVKKILENSKK